MKIQKSSETINPFGGINFVIEQLHKSGVLKLIDNQLGARSQQAKYKYSEVLMNLWSVFMCGGDCSEDIEENLKESLRTIPGHKVCGADTILRVLKSLSTAGEVVKSSTGNVYSVNRHELLNQLNIDILKHTKQLKEGNFYDLDYDNELLATEKKDAKKSYKKERGYFPGMATISGHPVYFENRDGNMHVKTNQADVLRRCFKILEDNKIYIDRSRMDAGSYSKEIISVVEQNSNYFYIRANRCEHLTHELLSKKDWEKVTIKGIEYEVCDISDYRPFTYKKSECASTYRLVVTRSIKKQGVELDLFTKDNMQYRSIITNDLTTSAVEIVKYYNQRGAEERVIDVMNNDFGWRNMPFSYMNQNTVFLIVMMICKNIYSWLMAKFSAKFTGLKPHYRIKKFIFRFITVPTKWISRGNQMILRIFSNKPYEMIFS